MSRLSLYSTVHSENSRTAAKRKELDNCELLTGIKDKHRTFNIKKTDKPSRSKLQVLLYTQPVLEAKEFVHIGHLLQTK